MELTPYQIDMINNIVNLKYEYWLKMNEIADIKLKRLKETEK